MLKIAFNLPVRLVGIIFVLFLVTVFISQKIFVTNLTLAKNNQNILSLSNENKELQVKLAKIDSLDYLKKQAKKQGFLENPKMLYLIHNELAQK